MESRVVPATGVTMCRSSPSSALVSDDLPTLGRPTIVMRGVELVGLRVFGHRGEHRVKQIARAAPRHGGDCVGLSQTEGVEVVHGVQLVVVVDLVYDEQHFFARPTEQSRHHLVKVGDACAHFDQKQYHVGLVDGEYHLTADILLENVVATDRVSARVDYRKFATVPVGFTVMTVARGSRRGVDNGLPRPHQTIKQRALAHIRSSDYRY